jgi:hypothetical protein
MHDGASGRCGGNCRRRSRRATPSSMSRPRGTEPGRPLRAARLHPAAVRCCLAVWRADTPCLPPTGGICLYVRATPCYLALLSRSVCTTTALAGFGSVAWTWVGLIMVWIGRDHIRLVNKLITKTQLIKLLLDTCNFYWEAHRSKPLLAFFV